MSADVGVAIARRALDLVGTPYKLGGRIPNAGLDCVGVVALALAERGAAAGIPDDYALRGEYLGRVSAFFDRAGFRRVDGEPLLQGDLLLCQPAVRQCHLAVVTSHGAVHAHAGLRRVVLTPLPLPWPLTGHWRSIGD